ncbi:Cilia- and flagella-associated protein 77 [Dissostichus eleginoides]|uniref:Cilia- and flagella-associated protein 77 n=1 Tax=Dissostichus eleginoides TaxID=100907 RepID=A0AAD9C4D8_DISEL|nr:Cilia- and flagella-associated protein 77 [Dissostichus eleginoides]
MSSPRLGVMRDSMLTNPLHIKASLGRSVSRGFSVPGPDFTFGMSNDSTEGGVAEVLSSWLVQRRSDSAPSQPLPPDFLSLNRDAVRSGIVTSKELSQYRAQMGGAYSQSHAPTHRGAGLHGARRCPTSRSESRPRRQTRSASSSLISTDGAGWTNR